MIYGASFIGYVLLLTAFICSPYSAVAVRTPLSNGALDKHLRLLSFTVKQTVESTRNTLQALSTKSGHGIVTLLGKADDKKVLDEDFENDLAAKWSLGDLAGLTKDDAPRITYAASDLLINNDDIVAVGADLLDRLNESSGCKEDVGKYLRAARAVVGCLKQNVAPPPEGKTDVKGMMEIICDECSNQTARISRILRQGFPQCRSRTQEAIRRGSRVIRESFRLVCIRDDDKNLCLPRLGTAMGASLGKAAANKRLDAVCEGSCFNRMVEVMSDKLDCKPGRLFLNVLCHQDDAGRYCVTQVRNNLHRFGKKENAEDSNPEQVEEAAKRVENFCQSQCGLKYVSAFRSAYDKQTSNCGDRNSDDEIQSDAASDEVEEEEAKQARVLRHMCAHDGTDYCVPRVLRGAIKADFNNGSFPACVGALESEGCSEDCRAGVQTFVDSLGCCSRAEPWLSLGKQVDDDSINFIQTKCAITMPSMCADALTYVPGAGGDDTTGSSASALGYSSGILLASVLSVLY